MGTLFSFLLPCDVYVFWKGHGLVRFTKINIYKYDIKIGI